MKTGEIHRVCLDPAFGDEIRKTRPVVVLNAGDQKSLRLAIVVPITRWRKKWASVWEGVKYCSERCRRRRDLSMREKERRR